MAKSSRKSSRGSKVNDTLFVVGTVIATAAVATFLGYLVGMYGIQRITGSGPVPRVRNVEVTSKSLSTAEEVKAASTVSQAPLPSHQPSQTPTPTQPQSRSDDRRTALYRVQVGAFSVRANADNMVRRLKEEIGLDAIVVGTGPYRVQVGAFSDRSNAERLRQELISKGYEAVVVQ